MSENGAISGVSLCHIFSAQEAVNFSNYSWPCIASGSLILPGRFSTVITV